MPRKKKKILKLDTDSYLELLNETYSDLFDLTNRLTGKYKTSEKLIDDSEDNLEKIQLLNTLGKNQNDTLKLIHDSLKTKLEITKMTINGINNTEEQSNGESVTSFNMEDFNNLDDIIKKMNNKDTLDNE